MKNILLWMLTEIEKEGYRNIKVGCIHKASKCSSSWTRERRPAAAASTLPTYTRKESVSLCASSLTLSPQGTIVKETINKTAKSLALWWSQVQLSHWNSLVYCLHSDSFQVFLMHRIEKRPLNCMTNPLDPNSEWYITKHTSVLLQDCNPEKEEY